MKKLILAYTFDADIGEITFTSYASIDIEGILLITNVTANIIIYNFADTSTGGLVTGNVLNLSYDTSLMNDSDSLQIFYDDNVIPATADKQLADNHQVLVSNFPTVLPTVDTTTLQFLRMLIEGISKPPWFDGSANAIRTQVQSGTVTTVTTVTNLTNIGSQSADMQNRLININTWSSACRSRIS